MNDVMALVKEKQRLAAELSKLAEQESGGDKQIYSQLLMGPGKTKILEGLAGSEELESIRQRIENVPLPQQPQRFSGGKRSKATQKGRRKMSIKTKNTKNIRKTR